MGQHGILLQRKRRRFLYIWEVTLPWFSRYTVDKIQQQQNQQQQKPQTKTRINITNYETGFWFIFSAFIFIFFFHFFFQSEKRRTIPLTTFNVKVCTVTKWSIILFFLIVYATLRHKQVTRNATCDTFAYYIINLMNGLCQKTLCRLIQNSSLQ